MLHIKSRNCDRKYKERFCLRTIFEKISDEIYAEFNCMCLGKDNLWQQIDLYHGTEDVYIPRLESKIVRFDKELTQQQLLDIIIASYRLSSNKMKLHASCILFVERGMAFL